MQLKCPYGNVCSNRLQDAFFSEWSPWPLMPSGAARRRTSPPTIPRRPRIRCRRSSPNLTGTNFEHPYQVTAYKMAAKIPGVLHQEPCYCRCDRAMGHNSLHSCFEGLHGAECSVCLKEAVYSYQQTKHGAHACPDPRRHRARGVDERRPGKSRALESIFAARASSCFARCHQRTPARKKISAFHRKKALSRNLKVFPVRQAARRQQSSSIAPNIPVPVRREQSWSAERPAVFAEGLRDWGRR